MMPPFETVLDSVTIIGGDGIGATDILLHFHLPNLASICKYASKETFSSKSSNIEFFSD